MSRRAWKKREKLRKSEEKRQIDAIVPFGALTAPDGAPLNITDCLSCGAPTTETWLLTTGKVACGACVSDRDLVLLAIAQEVGRDPQTGRPRNHLLAPSQPATAAG